MSSRKHAPYTAFKNAIAGKGLTLKDVAEVINVTESTLSLKISGGSDFYLSEIKAICEAFGFDSSIFFCRVCCLNDDSVTKGGTTCKAQK